MAGRSRTVKWLLDHVGYDGEDCLIWPFSKDNRGYAQLAYKGKVRRGHRVICEFVNGPPPTRLHQAAHNCGKGNLGCVHPKHVEWKTATENQLDRRRHGTHGCGAGKRGSVTPEQVREIRALKGELTQRALAERYGISDATVRGIQTGRWWKHVA
jgi:hypothetical protein